MLYPPAPLLGAAGAPLLGAAGPLGAPPLVGP
jgi:hypothetical protein